MVLYDALGESVNVMYIHLTKQTIQILKGAHIKRSTVCLPMCVCVCGCVGVGVCVFRAFADDECVAVIDQSPNTSDTRARPLGPGLVMVQMEPPPEDLREEDLRENHQRSLMEDNAVPMETFPLCALLDSQVREITTICRPSRPGQHLAPCIFYAHFLCVCFSLFHILY